MAGNIITQNNKGLPALVLCSSVGKKYLMAVSGFILIGYIFGHMLGNLQIFIGQDQINLYAEKLHSIGALLWVIRAFLLVMFGIHVWTSITLKLENYTARPTKYSFNYTKAATLSSRTMIWTGLLVLSFVTYHVLHFTAIVTNPEYTNLINVQGHMDVYSMVIYGFKNPLISIAYFIAMVMVSFHVSHALASMFQTMGWNNEKSEPILHKISVAFGWIIFLGFISIPVAVLTGFLELPKGGITL